MKIANVLGILQRMNLVTGLHLGGGGGGGSVDVEDEYKWNKCVSSPTEILDEFVQYVSLGHHEAYVHWSAPH